MMFTGWAWAPLIRSAVIAAVTAGALALPAVAVADRDYSVRFTRNAQGDITGTGNTLLTCRDDVAQCTAARAGQGGNARRPMVAVHRRGAPARTRRDAGVWRRLLHRLLCGPQRVPVRRRQLPARSVLRRPRSRRRGALCP